MVAHASHPALDRLRADLALLHRRATELQSDLDDDPPEQVASFSQRVVELLNDLEQLERVVDDDSELEIGTPTRHRILAEEFDALEADYHAATKKKPSDYEVAVDRQLRVWRARLDDLQVQRALGSMELRDELSSLSERVDHVRSGVLVDLQNVLEDSGEVVVDLRDDIEEVLIDVRRGLKNAYRALFVHD